MVNLMPTPEDDLAKSMETKGLSTQTQRRKLVDEMADARIFGEIDLSHNNVAQADRALQGLTRRVGWNPFTRGKNREHNDLLTRVQQRDELRADLTRVNQEIARATRLKNAIDARVARIDERLQRSNRVFGAWHSFWLRRAETKQAKNEAQLTHLEGEAATAREGLSEADRSSLRIKQNFVKAQEDMELAWEELEPYLNPPGYSAAHLAAASANDLGGVLVAMGLLQPTGAGTVFAYGRGMLPGRLAGQVPAWLNPALVHNWSRRRSVAETLRRLQTAFLDMERYRASATALEVIDETRAQAKQKIDAILALTGENKTQTLENIATMREQEQYLDQTGTWEVERLQVSPENEEVLLPHRTIPNCFVRFGYEATEHGFTYVLPGDGRTSSLAEAAHAQLGVERRDFVRLMVFGAAISMPTPPALAPLGVTFTPTMTAAAPAAVTHVEASWNHPLGHSGTLQIPVEDIPLVSGVAGARLNGQPTFAVDGAAFQTLVRERMYAAHRDALRTAALLGTAVPSPLQNALQTLLGASPFAGMANATVQINPGPPQTLRGVEYVFTHPGTGVVHRAQVTDPASFPVDFTPTGVQINAAALATALQPTLNAAQARFDELGYLETNGITLATALSSTFDQFPDFKNGAATVTYVPLLVPTPAHFTWESTKLGGISIASGTMQLSPEDLTFVRTGGTITGIDSTATQRVMRTQLEGLFQKQKEVAKEVRAALRLSDPAKDALIRSLSVPTYNKATSEWEITIRKQDGNQFTLGEADLADIRATFTPTPAPGSWSISVDPALTSKIASLL